MISNSNHWEDKDTHFAAQSTALYLCNVVGRLLGADSKHFCGPGWAK